MAEPSNIRVNPFTGTGGATNYVELTEKHIIPAVSPYVIRLNEVPEKQDPSNMKMVYVNESTGAATSTTLTEVAATPGKGEFRPDYSANALEDKTWNTGLIEFSASDAGKIVQVTYTGTGTLAGVNSNHWPSWYTDRGDGSDGDFMPTGNTTISGVKNYKSVFIKAGITVTCSSNTWIKCQGAFINNGVITVEPSGAFGGQGASGSGSSGNSSGCIGEALVSAGGAGGAGGGYSDERPPGGPGGAGGLSRITANEKLFSEALPFIIYGFGAGGGGGGGSAYSSSDGVGGRGGGVFFCTANVIINNSINAIGGTGATDTSNNDGRRPGSGGGGGGAIVLIANTVNKQGTLTVTGGSPGTYGSAKAGAKGFAFSKSLGVI